MFAIAAFVVTLVLHLTEKIDFPLVAIFYLIEAELILGSYIPGPWRRNG